MGFQIKTVPDSTFYLWLDLEGLPPAISDGLNFFQACLEERVIVVPGIFFDLNPSKRRDLFDSPCHHFVRFSYGPKMETLKNGLDGIERVVNRQVIRSYVFDETTNPVSDSNAVEHSKSEPAC